MLRTRRESRQPRELPIVAPPGGTPERQSCIRASRGNEDPYGASRVLPWVERSRYALGKPRLLTVALDEPRK
jgi:hypothetical protein